MSKSTRSPGSDAQWETLLHQLQQHPKAAPQPFFYTRVHARLLAQAAPPTALLPNWLRRPAYAAVLCALGLAVSGDGAGAVPAGPDSRASNPAQQLTH